MTSTTQCVKTTAAKVNIGRTSALCHLVRGQYPGSPLSPTDPRLDLATIVSMETETGGEESREEKIVYL
ncbi:unnamed protein product [Arctogadus glacialis]